MPFATLLFATQAAADTSGVDLFNRFLQTTQTFEAGFVQQVRDDAGAVLEEAGGRVWLHRPGRFRWHYSEPFEREIVSDGKQLWMFDAELEQVTVARLTSGLGKTPAGILSGDTEVLEKFSAGPVSEVDGISWIELRPKQADSDFAEVGLGFAGTMLAQLMLKDRLGQTTAIVFTDAVLNPQLADELFVFEVPENADVIEHSGF
ncbi:MAG: outer membrane lipoprotein chaperone LolA [Gammaproteobacteria bacterium]